MEELYLDENNIPWASQKFKLSELFDEYTRILTEEVYKEDPPETADETALDKIARKMGISKEDCQSISEMCNINQLDSVADNNPGPEMLKRTKHSSDDEDALLNKGCLTLATAFEHKTLKAPNMKMRYLQRLKDLRRTAVPTFVREPNPSPAFSVPEHFVVVARVFKPFERNNMVHSIPHAQDFMLHGSQKLTDFRDRIVCSFDEVSVGDSDSPDRVPLKSIVTSGMFYFGNTFYSDGRNLTCQDYGTLIAEWIQNNPHFKNNQGQVHQKKMEETVVSDLEIRLGFPYVYLHLGHCEHIVVFLDVRLMTPDDPQNVAVYPLVEAAESNVLYCFACDIYVAKWILEDSSVPACLAYLCQPCYEAYYSRQGCQVRPSFACMIPDQPGVRSDLPLPGAAP